jgi:endogenous inhibitor of DNA gyrase (YacG/DUF329 family)
MKSMDGGLDDSLHVRCPRCGAGSPLEEALARSTDSWPNQRWLLVECPGCGSPVHLEVSDGRVEVGELDGGPGPCLVVSQTLDVPGLGVRIDGAGIRVEYRGVRRRVPARR